MAILKVAIVLDGGFLVEATRPLMSVVPEYVDLGLPSGTLWADRNIGAAQPLDSGLYFSWGNVVGHEYGSYTFSSDAYDVTDGHGVSTDLDSAHDAAAVLLGTAMPSVAQINELIENCDIEAVGDNGIAFVSQINGASILFPMNGYIVNDTKRDDTRYWGASTGISGDTQFNAFMARVGYGSVFSVVRFAGFTIRAVMQPD